VKISNMNIGKLIIEGFHISRQCLHHHPLGYALLTVLMFDGKWALYKDSEYRSPVLTDCTVWGLYEYLPSKK
jgi:hypothetical protein